MVRFYVMKIRTSGGAFTIEDVPAVFRERVRAELEQEQA